ncbi:unnamed protein product [Adineta steineri]|uniref:Uncharacterized protein n=1 Tax=Adineta steineri TaxID=433720 RepID=A0A819D1E5_9BILA|nr:unnamed protein product [Adineta steineri]CAF1451935.1 unnamed protein product [Adineta steineri]CAF3778782.1 unnamed protein product [Adineta steineri]CAF3825699.1 unnamed protein product [Adineta steineri]CAF3902152.1 unnamed protein product [Adineta steineri]
MGFSRLSICILSCKIISLICLIISIYSYHWFQIDNYLVNDQLIQDLCTSYGAFCNINEQMPLPRLVIILPCLLSTIGLLLEIINLCLLCSIQYRIRTILNFFLEQTSIALSFAITIHCTWVSAVHIRIAIEIDEVHLNWTFFAFGFVTILFPIDCICSITRMMNNCQYEQRGQVKKHNIQICKCLRLKQRCYEYGSNCYKDNHIQRKIWLYLIIPILNVIIESSNILLLLCTRSRSRINLILEEITLVTSLVFIVPNVFIVLAICVYAHSRYEEIDWSMKIYFISVILCLIDFVCSVVRVVSYCRHNSFRSHPVTYTSNSNHETINIQSE